MIEMAEAVISTNQCAEDADAAAKIALLMWKEAEKEIEKLKSIIDSFDKFVNSIEN